MVAAGWSEGRLRRAEYGFLATIDGVPVAMAQIAWLDGGLPYLGGATTLPSARGRGAFRDLVRARWDEAVRRGVPILLTQAGRLSRPILEDLGFHGTARLDILRDTTS
jgi:GNAT superfamily N-acetyltransferase